MNIEQARFILVGLHDEHELSDEEKEAIATILDAPTMSEAADKLDAGLDRADIAMKQALAAGEVQTQLLRVLVDQTRYQYIPPGFSGNRYRVDTRTGVWEPVN